MAKKTSNDSSHSDPDSLSGGKDGQNAADQALQAMPFEDALSELERIVSQMENGSLSLEQSLAAYKRGVALVARCRDNLTSAHQQVKILEGDLMKPFDFDDEE